MSLFRSYIRSYIISLLAILLLSAPFASAAVAIETTAETATAVLSRAGGARGESGEEFCESINPFECGRKKRPKCTRIKIRICLHINGCEELDSTPKCKEPEAPEIPEAPEEIN